MKKIALLVAATAASAAFAGEKNVAKPVVTPEQVFVSPWSLKLDAAWVREGDYDKGGSGSVYESRLQLAWQHPVSIGLLSGHGGTWVMRLGVEYERFTFDHSGAPDFLPGSLQSTAAVIGLEYRTPRGIGAILEARPGLFFEHHATGDSFDLPVKAAVVFSVNERFAVVLGATYSGHRKNPVYPVAGIWWKITDKLTLNAIPPDPRLEYEIHPDVRLFLGAELAGGSFRTDAGRDDKLNEAVVSYTDYRSSAGVAWKINEGWSLDAGAGVSFYRKFDFHRAEVGVKTDDLAPFVKLSLRGEF